jgi:hypothetical protein
MKSFQIQKKKAAYNFSYALLRISPGGAFKGLETEIREDVDVGVFGGNICCF